MNVKILLNSFLFAEITVYLNKQKHLEIMNTVVLIDVEFYNARKVCERVEGETIDDFDNHPEFSSIDPNLYMVYGLSDFMDLVNDQELDILTNYFITFVNTK